MNTTWKETTDLNEIAQAFRDEREVETIYGGTTHWEALSREHAINRLLNQPIRIAIPPAARPWSKPSDVPGPVCWIRPVGEPWNTYLIHTLGGESDPMVYGNGFTQRYPIGSKWEHSTDRKEWKPCTITD